MWDERLLLVYMHGRIYGFSSFNYFLNTRFNDIQNFKYLGIRIVRILYILKILLEILFLNWNESVSNTLFSNHGI